MAKGSRTGKGGKFKPAFKKTQTTKSGSLRANGTGRFNKGAAKAAKAAGLRGRSAASAARSNPGGGG